MKHLYFKSLVTRVSVFLVLFCAALIINSCRKDNNFTRQPVKGNIPGIATYINFDALKAVYAKGTAGNKNLKTTDISQQTLVNIVGTLNVDWSTYTLQTYADSTQVIEFAMPDDTSLFIPNQAVVSKNLKYRTKTNAVFILKKDTVAMSFFMKTVEDLNAPGYQPTLDQMHYGQTPATFTGNVLYFTLARNFINGYAWSNGFITSTIDVAPLAAAPQVQSIGRKLKVGQVTTCTSETYDIVETTTVTVHWEGSTTVTVTTRVVGQFTVTTCQTSGGSSGSGGSGAPGGVSGGSGGSGGPATPPPPLCIPPSGPISVEASVHGRLTIQVTQQPGGGATTSPQPCNPNPATPQPTPAPTQNPATITNNVQNPCLHAMVDAAINRNIRYDLSASMNGIFNTNTNFNLNFLDAPLDPSIDGETVPTHTLVDRQQGTGRLIITGMDLNITLNSTVLPGASQEFITATILHEALHAYFRTIGTIDDHDTMVNQYIPWFEAALKTIYPTMQDSDIQALAFGGLTQTMAMSVSIYSTQKNSFDLINQIYKQGAKGTPCH